MLLMAYLDRHSKVISLITNDFICCISLIGDKDITISVFQRREKEKSCCRNTPSSSSDSFYEFDISDFAFSAILSALSANLLAASAALCARELVLSATASTADFPALFARAFRLSNSSLVERANLEAFLASFLVTSFKVFVKSLIAEFALFNCCLPSSVDNK